MAKDSRGGKVGSSAQISTVNDLYKLVVGSDSYVFDKEYQEASANASKYYNEKQELSDKISALNDELKNEVEVDPTLGRNLSMVMGFYTERGKKIDDQIKKLREQQQTAEDKWHSATAIIGKRDAAAREAQLKAYQQPGVKAASQKSYKGFEMDTHTPYLQEKLNRGEAFIAEMSPKQYLEQVAYNIFGKSSLESAVRGATPSSVKKYAKMMKSGTKFYMPSLNYDTKNQEGRHRALAAIINGIDKMPVLIVPKKR